MKESVMNVFLIVVFLLKLDGTIGENVKNLTADQKRLQTIEYSMAVNEDPCGDFYKYACTEWPKVQNASESIQVLENHIKYQMLDILETFAEIKEPEFLTSVYNYYQSCRNLENTNSLEYLKWMHREDNIAWPLITSGNNISLNWLELLALTRKYGFNEIFFYEDILQSPDDSLKLAIELKRPALAALDDFNTQTYSLRNYMNAEKREEFAQFQKELLNVTVQLIKSEENGTLEFVQNTLKIPSESTMIPRDLSKLQMPWLSRYLAVLLNQSHVDPNMPIYIHSAKYFQVIYEFVSQHDNQFICEYIQFKFLKFLQNKDNVRQRGDCLQSTRHLFPLIMQWAYEKNNLQLMWQNSLIRTIFEHLKNKFRQNLSSNSYGFSDDIMQYLKAKIDNLNLITDADLSFDELQRYYGNLSLHSDDYYGNRLKIFRLEFQKLHEGISRTLKKTSPELLLLATAKYDNIENTISLGNLPQLYSRLNLIYLPVTLLRQPYYEDGLSDLYTYSSIGFYLSREIVKAFHPPSLLFDPLGSINQSMYEKIQSNPKFQRSTEHLRGYFRRELYNVDEAIYDLAGLELAYEAFAEMNTSVLQASANIHGTSISLEKIFFLSYAQNFCGRLCGQSLLGFLHYDLCDRVNRPVLHFKKFLQAFKCNEYDSLADSMWH